MVLHMGTISRAKATCGLSASGAHAATNVSGDAAIGVTDSGIDISTADVAYTFQVTATALSDVAELTYSSGVVTQDTGTPTISDGDGKDFEGATLPTLYRVLCMRFSCPSTNTNTVTFGGVPVVPGGVSFTYFGAGLVVGSSTADVDFSGLAGTIGDNIEITIIGKTT